MILYPTETVYGLGVHALDEEELERLYTLKGRDAAKSVSWLVRDIDDVRDYAEVDETAAKIARRFLPGPLTLVLPLRQAIRDRHTFLGETIGFRISPDPKAKHVIEEFMAQQEAPLSATSANRSGLPTRATVPEILAQFGERRKEIDTVIDDGERNDVPTTVVEVKNEHIIVHREGKISAEIIRETL